MWRRYSALHSFHLSLLPLDLPPTLKASLADAFPQKDYLSDSSDPAFLIRRQELLQTYFHLLQTYVNGCTDFIGESASKVTHAGVVRDNVFSYDSESCTLRGLFEVLEVGGKELRGGGGGGGEKGVEAWHYFVDGGREEVRGMYGHLAMVEEARVAAAASREPAEKSLLGSVLLVLAATVAVAGLLLAGAAGEEEGAWWEGRRVEVALYGGLAPLVIAKLLG